MWPFGASTKPSNTSSTSSDEEDGSQTARQARSARRDRLRSTPTSNNLLQVPAGPRGLQIRRSPSPQDLIRSIQASRSSPAASPTASANQTSDTVAMAIDPEQLTQILTAALQAANANNADNNRQIVEAAVNAAAANNVAAQQSMRRPAPPPFDPKDIKNWL